MAQVKLFGNLRQHTGQLAVTASGATIGAVLEGLCASYPALTQAILDGDQLRSHVRVMVNGRDIELADGLATPVSETDQVAIFPPIAGGSLYHQPRAMPHSFCNLALAPQAALACLQKNQDTISPCCFDRNITTPWCSGG